MKVIIRFIAIILIATGLRLIYQVHRIFVYGLLPDYIYISIGFLIFSTIILIVFIPCSFYGGLKLFCLNEKGRKIAIIALITGIIFYVFDFFVFHIYIPLGEIYIIFYIIINIIGILILESKNVIKICGGSPFLPRISFNKFYSTSLSYAEKLAVIVAVLSLCISLITVYYSYFKKSYGFMVTVNSCDIKDAQLNIGVNLINSGNTYVAVDELNIAFSEYGNGIISCYKNIFHKNFLILSNSSSTLEQSIVLHPGEIKGKFINMSEKLNKKDLENLTKRPFIGIHIDLVDSNGRRHSIFYLMGKISLQDDGSIASIIGPLQRFSRNTNNVISYTTRGRMIFQVY